MQLPSKDPKILPNGDYKVDIFNHNPIFQIKDKDRNYFVRDWNEAFCIHRSPNPEDINHQYIAAFITDQADSTITPYKRISRIPRGHNVKILGNKFFLFEKEFFKNNITYKNYTLDELNFIIKDKIESKIKFHIKKSNGNIACEHSSGLDSNALVSFIKKKIKFPKENFYTVSTDLDEEGELIRKFRNIYGLKLENCFGVSDFENLWNSKNDNYDSEMIFRVFGAPSLRPENIFKSELLRSKDCNLLFSGFGGDQVLSHHGRNLQSDYLINFEIRELLKWYKNDSYALITKKILGRIIKTVLNKPLEYNTKRILKNKLQNRNIIKFLNEYGKRKILKHIKIEYPWETNEIITQRKSLINRVLAEWVCVRVEDEIRMNKAFGIKKVYPFLDEELISILLKINPKHYSNYGDERFLIRELFKSYLPNYLYNNPKKYRESFNETVKVRNNLLLNQIDDFVQLMKDKNYLARKYWDIDKILKESLKDIDINTNQADGYFIRNSWVTLRKIHSINIWLQKLHD